MGKGKIAAALAGGLTGYMKGMQINRQTAQEDEDRALRREDHELRKRESDIRLRGVERAEQDQIALRNAAAPTTVNEVAYPSADDEGNAMPSAPPVYGAGNAGGVQLFSDKAGADSAAAARNDPVALSNRISGALNAQGKPVEAMQFQTAAMQHADKIWDRDIRDAMGKGHEGIADFMTKSQGTALKGKTLRAVPSEDGKTVTYSMVNEDGTLTPTKYTLPNDQNGVIQAAYQLSRIDPETRYRHMVEEDKRAAANAFKERELTLKQRDLDEVKIPRMEAQNALSESRATLAEARATVAGAKAAGGGDKLGREERLRYTTLFSESGRRLGEAKKSLATLQKEPLYSLAKPGSAQHRELEALRSDVKAYEEERKTYGSLLSNSQGGEAAKEDAAAKPKPGAAPAAAKASTMPAPTSKAEYEKLASGTKYRHPDGTVKVKP